MSVSARIFVAIVFIILGFSFIATTYVLYDEFRQTNWFSFAAFYSHLFIFFPTFGIIALIAFYIPSVVFTDMYWRHLRLGPIRFLCGMAVLIGASYFISTQILKGDVPTLWGLSPTVLKADKGEPIGCDSTQQTCLRVSVLEALVTVRQESQRRLGMSKFARQCDIDPLLEVPQAQQEKRYCFVTKTLTDAQSCCQAQKRFTEALATMYKPEENRSRIDKVHALLLPFKIFFLLVLLIIGFLLATRRRRIDQHYAAYVQVIERGLMIGAVAMLIWPISNHAFLQSGNLLYGTYSDGIYASLAPVLSILFGAWALMLLFFFFRRFEKDLEAVGKIAGVIGSAIAILKYEEIIDYSVRFAGSGASQVTFGILIVLGFFAFVPLVVGRQKSDRNGQSKPEEAA